MLKLKLARFTVMGLPLTVAPLLMSTGLLQAQTANSTPALSNTLPDAPSASPNPGYAAVAPVRLDARGKAAYYGHDVLSFDSIMAPAIVAATVMASPPKAYPNPWRQGAEAYGRNFGGSLASLQTAAFSRFVSGIVLREDPRYYPSANRALGFRALHAIAFTLVDRSDSGHSMPALANFIGATAGGFVGNAYYPANYTDLRHAGVRTGVQLGNFAASNLADEFAPEIKRITRALTSPFRRHN